MIAVAIFIVWCLACAVKEAQEDFDLMIDHEPVHHTFSEWIDRAIIVVAGGASADDKVKAKSKAPKEERAVTIPNESTSTQLSALSTKPGPFEEAVKLYSEKKYSRALAIFQSIIKKDSLSSTEAQWYSSLIYLKTNKPEKAKQILERLSSERNSRKESADSLLKILR